MCLIDSFRDHPSQHTSYTTPCSHSDVVSSTEGVQCTPLECARQHTLCSVLCVCVHCARPPALITSAGCTVYSLHAENTTPHSRVCVAESDVTHTLC